MIGDQFVAFGYLLDIAVDGVIRLQAREGTEYLNSTPFEGVEPPFGVVPMGLNHVYESIPYILREAFLLAHELLRLYRRHDS